MTANLIYFHVVALISDLSGLLDVDLSVSGIRPEFVSMICAYAFMHVVEIAFLAITGF